MMNNNNNYYIVANRSFVTRTDAETYCLQNDFSPELMIEEKSDNNKNNNTKKLYWYSYRFRGFSIGCQPKGHIAWNDNIGKHGIVAYDRPLTDEEISAYELESYNQEIK